MKNYNQGRLFQKKKERLFQGNFLRTYIHLADLSKGSEGLNKWKVIRHGNKNEKKRFQGGLGNDVSVNYSVVVSCGNKQINTIQ